MPDYRGCRDDGSYLNIDIKMETGTGKTYVYTQTIYEMHKGLVLISLLCCTIFNLRAGEAALKSRTKRLSFALG